MAVCTVQNGKRYRATIKLGGLKRFASNDMLADKFREAGFTEVDVSGSGHERQGQGLWPHADASAEVPDEITAVEEIEV